MATDTTWGNSDSAHAVKKVVLSTTTDSWAPISKPLNVKVHAGDLSKIDCQNEAGDLPARCEI